LREIAARLYTWRGAILTGQAHDFYKYCTQSEEQELRFWRAKCDFETSETARRAISSSFYQFMYVLIISLIMLFVNSIMSS
jgi:hypothetical protein